MTPTGITPLDAATAVLQNPTLPAGDDERFVGFGVLGLPFASGHYLALRYFPATSFAPPYRSVWHRDPDGGWTFYATTPGPQSCARYFSSVTRHDAVQCGIEVAWVTSWSLAVRIEELLEWEIDLSATLSTRALSTVGTRLPAGAWASRAVLGLIGRLARPALRAGQLRLAGTAPNGQRFTLAPRQLWVVSRSQASWRGVHLGPVGPLPRQPRLAGFRPPQRGVFVVGSGHFENFDADRHHAVPRTVAIR
ncbi:MULTISPECIES: hypothetical protein [Mycobacterium]|uniref:Uncharacterized protein n=1 Tax=Mycobacterium kiyosense TaxID=2871094 RepID=A0A9P3Q3N5_9MYCO|nr:MULTISPECIES: hypothetical protein [Mycobacterium]BDB40907.1 hypothetical protein IWGMT90018_13530 [Mycobacterium kiyosense]BDE12703.1 hypothetical protein MKCMC460_15630 [Mycobacterium sp. 20KCMC460]GLB82644.1 hypothetical protein SRL2020028_19000 [Mycobacterium kiyosense]GLB87850.1 hypothetical protein SRL2020130_06670 [Mycobacterium kiyosense]GLB94007.1 hypothetical protein SRL2020226_07830 [Mycobacterium kiyosense]